MISRRATVPTVAERGTRPWDPRARMTTDAQSLRPQTAYRSEKRRARTFHGARARLLGGARRPASFFITS